MHEQCDKERGGGRGRDEGESLLGRQLFPNCWFSEPRIRWSEWAEDADDGGSERGREKKGKTSFPPSPFPAFPFTKIMRSLKRYSLGTATNQNS